jgi:hypothetical protein
MEKCLTDSLRNQLVNNGTSTDGCGDGFDLFIWMGEEEGMRWSLSILRHCRLDEDHENSRNDNVPCTEFWNTSLTPHSFTTP